MGFWSKSWVPTLMPRRLLCLLFVFWKAILFVVIICSPGPGYDTSTTLLDCSKPVSHIATDFLSSSRSLNPVLLKLVRWDAIYFSQLSRRGYVFEQEWAFGLGLPGSVSFISMLIRQFGGTRSALLEIIVAVVLSHLAHFLAVLLLYALSQRIFRSHSASSTAISTVAAALHIISPAGAFLSAPNSESMFSTLNFLGFYLYLDGTATAGSLGDIETICAGISFGCATMVRSNGVLGGLLFLYDATLQVLDLVRTGVTTSRVRRLSVLGVGGLLVAAGAFLPQYQAYRRFCEDAVKPDRRPWCDSLFPSIYGWVQQHYWHVGLFRYWTLSNLPLFLLAMPCLMVLLVSSIWAWRYTVSNTSPSSKDGKTCTGYERESLIRLALPQVVLALAAFTTYHVQTVNRLSSAYPLWYIWLATMIATPPRDALLDLAKQRRRAKLVVRSAVIYAIFQGGLFASFLPPA